MSPRFKNLIKYGALWSFIGGAATLLLELPIVTNTYDPTDTHGLIITPTFVAITVTAAYVIFFMAGGFYGHSLPVSRVEIDEDIELINSIGSYRPPIPTVAPREPVTERNNLLSNARDNTFYGNTRAAPQDQDIKEPPSHIKNYSIN